MKVYINGIGSVNAQQAGYTDNFLAEIQQTEQHSIRSIEPDYKAFINPTLIRRMGRIIKMGVASAKMCLNDAGVEQPDAILTGTGLGCIEDTEKFLGAIIQNNEQVLTPTSFIQSTHNTVGGQIALMLGCNNYNFTYVHRAFSFESCVQDAMMLLAEKAEQNVLLYLGKATKNAHSTRQLFFGSNAPEIGDVTDEARPGIYGWIFSHSEGGLAYSAQDSNWAVILNLTDIDVPLKTSALFPFGAQAFVLFQKPDFHYDEGDGLFAPLGYIRGEDPAPELTELISALPTSPNGTVMLPAYSIVLLRSGNQVIIGAPHIEVSSTSNLQGSKSKIIFRRHQGASRVR